MGTARHVPTRRVALLWAVAGIVHCSAAASTVVAQTKRAPAKDKNRAKEPPQIVLGRGAEGLPPAVGDMRAAIIAAAETGDIAELKGAMDLNELPPELGNPAGIDRIQHLRNLSSDGSGKDVLVMLLQLFEGTWAAIPGGRDPENNRIYVWPHFAEVPLDKLGEEDRSALAALAGAEAAAAMLAARRYQGWRLSIGADGVWHMLTQVR